MFAKLQKQFGTAGLALSVIAIVLALGGGAYAANHATASKAKQGKQGKPGKNGTNGTNGAPGATGPAGPAGPAGAAGTGKEGPQGKQGIQGIQGLPGKSGFTKTLPEKETETGVWSIRSTSDQLGQAENSFAPVSFSIPLAQPMLILHHAFFIGEGGPANPEQEAACPGSVASPAAALGDFCAYTKATSSLTPIRIFSPNLSTSFTGVSGLLLSLEPTAALSGNAFGSWAVTAPEEE